VRTDSNIQYVCVHKVEEKALSVIRCGNQFDVCTEGTKTEVRID